MTDVDLWVDPACPWAWLTSRWLLEVEQVRDVRVRFHVMSLGVLNEFQSDSGEHREKLRPLWGPVRVLTAARSLFGSPVVRPLYAAMGNRIHPGGAGLGPDMLVGALDDLRLPHSLADAVDSSAHDAALRASHEAGMALVGQDVGTPVVHVPVPGGETIAFFGPVVTPTPRDEDAGRLWDGVMAVAGTDGFFELKRSRTRRPSFA